VYSRIPGFSSTANELPPFDEPKAGREIAAQDLSGVRMMREVLRIGAIRL
jgi:hypothetical protein